MNDTVLGTIARHGMFAPGMRVGIAVSGGADSMCLLHLLHELAPHWNLHLSVVHINHRLRGEASLQDAEFVRGAADGFRMPFHLRDANVSEADDNLEQAGRLTRHQFFRELVDGGNLDRIATGHTRSDQAETVLYRLFRGSGLPGLCGVLPVTEAGLVRPLIGVARSAIEAWLGERGISWREDETNQHQSFARNRIRHEFLPLVRSTFNPRVDDALANLATLAQDEEKYWRTEIPAFPNSPIVLSVLELASANAALARRKIRRAIERVKGDLRQIEFDHIETVLEIARSEKGSSRVQLPGIDIFRSFEWIRIAPAAFDSGRPRDFTLPFQIPGQVRLPEDAGTVNFELIECEESPESHDKLNNELDWQTLNLLPLSEAAGASGSTFDSFELRNWRPGDQYRHVAANEPKNIKFLFQEARVPLWERRRWPVFVANGRIAWTRRFGAAADLARVRSTRRILRIREELAQ